eukprot:TRINITY_DN1635_c0_g1_i8.p1 TRINITY_DN1635_c0_g1~~TRINITY_DN1635_c0_g1_i8.p1  ORF type:complete len:446 (+),score=36.58 TRINITY_DN1635_c0_g1_i8:279-1616(+)
MPSESVQNYGCDLARPEPRVPASPPSRAPSPRRKQLPLSIVTPQPSGYQHTGGGMSRRPVSDRVTLLRSKNASGNGNMDQRRPQSPLISSPRLTPSHFTKRALQLSAEKDVMGNQKTVEHEQAELESNTSFLSIFAFANTNSKVQEASHAQQTTNSATGAPFGKGTPARDLGGWLTTLRNVSVAGISGLTAEVDRTIAPASDQTNETPCKAAEKLMQVPTKEARMHISPMHTSESPSSPGKDMCHVQCKTNSTEKDIRPLQCEVEPAAKDPNADSTTLLDHARTPELKGRRPVSKGILQSSAGKRSPPSRQSPPSQRMKLIAELSTFAKMLTSQANRSEPPQAAERGVEPSESANLGGPLFAAMRTEMQPESCESQEGLLGYATEPMPGTPPLHQVGLELWRRMVPEGVDARLQTQQRRGSNWLRLGNCSTSCRTGVRECRAVDA